MLTTFMCRLLPLTCLILPEKKNNNNTFSKSSFFFFFQTDYELMLHFPDLTLKVSIKTLTFH